MTVVEVGELCGDVGDVPKQPIHDVHEVAELRKEWSAIHVQSAFPGRFAIVAVVAVPIAIDLHHLDFAEHAIIHDLLEPFRRRRIAVLHDAKHLPRHLQGLEKDFFASRLGHAHGLLDHDMLFVIERKEGVLRMQPVGCANADDIRSRSLGKHLLCIGKKWNVVGPGLLFALRQNITNSHQIAIGVPFDDLGMPAANVAKPNDSKRSLVHKRRYLWGKCSEKWRGMTNQRQ